MYDEYKAKQEIVFERLRSEILDGLLLPGTKLEADAIAERLVVSRTPVREALRGLEATGLVMFSPDKGARVAVMPLEEVNEVAIIRVMLEGTAGRLGAKNITSEGLVRLR
ncbi:MAG: GntR family transcriptional regulator [Bacteroidota bacterium]